MKSNLPSFLLCVESCAQMIEPYAYWLYQNDGYKMPFQHEGRYEQLVGKSETGTIYCISAEEGEEGGRLYRTAPNEETPSPWPVHQHILDVIAHKQWHRSASASLGSDKTFFDAFEKIMVWANDGSLIGIFECTPKPVLQ